MDMPLATLLETIVSGVCRQPGVPLKLEHGETGTPLDAQKNGGFSG